jgi:hypothetical protein
MLSTEYRVATARRVFEVTASNARLYPEAWQTPLAMDQARYDL